MKKEAFRVKGKRVFLRYPDISDLDEFTRLARKSEQFHRGVFRLARTKAEFQHLLERASTDSTEIFLICEAESGRIVGVISLSQIFYGPFKSAYMGYALGIGFTGKGFATEAIRLMTRHAFMELKLHRIEANIQPQNKASKNAAKRSGFLLEGYSPRYLKIGGKWRDHERWAITKEDWKEKK